MKYIWIKSVALIWNCLVIMQTVDSVSWATDLTGNGRQQASFANSGGIYAGGCFDGVFAIAQD